MQKMHLQVAVAAVVAGLALVSAARAATLVYEPFAIGTGAGQYTAGNNLNTQKVIGGGASAANWLAPTTGTSRTDVVAQGLTYTSAGGDTLTTAGGAITWGWSNPITSSSAARMQRSTIALAAPQSTLYASVLVRIPAGGDVPEDGSGALISTAGSLIGFTIDSGSFRALGGGLKINKSGSTTTYTPTLFTSTATGAADSWSLNPLVPTAPAPSPVSYDAAQTVLLILKMESLAGNDRYTLYVNPADLDAEPAAVSVSTVGYGFYTAPINPASISLVSNVARREGTINSTSSFDEFRLGTSWGDVAPVPEPGMIGLAGAVMLFTARRRRA